MAARDGGTFESINPANGRRLADVAACDVADVEAAVASARAAFRSGRWSGMAPANRKRVLQKFADLVLANRDELALLETLDMGKPISDSLKIDVPSAARCIHWYAESIDKLYDEVAPTGPRALATITREPVGVVGAIVPWNFPLIMAAWKIGPVLAAGNSLVLKPSEKSPLTAIRIAALAHEAGIPEGVFNVVPGLGHEAGKAIGLHMDVDCVSFTGSGEVGRYFLEYSAKSNLKKVVLECGGKSPAVVMRDVQDIAPIIPQIAAGILFCQGENCSAGSRLIVEEPIRDRLLEALKAEFANWTVGNPFDADTRIGAMIEAKHLDKVTGLIAKGAAEGGKITFGGKRILEETGGYFVQPTIIENVKNDMIIAREEVFGPVLSVISVKDEAEALAVANDTPYGLAASIYTDNLNVAHRMAKGIRAGTVSVNCFSEGDFAMPFGGYKESGFGGKDKGLAAHDQYLEQKAIWIQLR